jgi:hypothetical protein
MIIVWLARFNAVFGFVHTGNTVQALKHFIKINEMLRRLNCITSMTKEQKQDYQNDSLSTILDRIGIDHSSRNDKTGKHIFIFNGVKLGEFDASNGWDLLREIDRPNSADEFRAAWLQRCRNE